MTARAPRNSTVSFTSGDLHETLWNADTGSGHARSVPSALVVRLSGPCTYPQFVKLAYYLGRRWDPLGQRLVLDLSGMQSAEKEGVTFLVNHLRKATARGGQVYFIRPQVLSRRERKELDTGQTFRVAGDLDQIFSPGDPRGTETRCKKAGKASPNSGSFLSLPEIEFLGLGIRA